MADATYRDGVPVFAAGDAAWAMRFEAGAPFWRALDQMRDDDPLSGQLDRLLAGAAAPRVWMLLHEPGAPRLSAAAALVLAKALMARGQKVLVLDVDESGSALTIWAEREETEGWIDVARFGASVLSAGAPLPFAGARGVLLGVGSFVPTDVTEDEIIALVSRLRHQSDDILLVAAVGPDALPWARRAERRLFCWDRQARADEQLGPVIGPFAASGVPLTGLLGFGEPAATADGGESAPTEAAVTSDLDEGLAADVVREFGDGPDDAPDDAGGDFSTETPGLEPEPVLSLGAELEPPRGTPRLTWLAAGAFAVALVAVGWYWSAHVRVPRGGYFEPVTAHDQTLETMPDSQAATVTTTADSATADTLAGGPPATGAAEAAPDTTRPAVVAEEPSAPATAGATAAPFDPAVYAVPVGQAGWALHVYSLPDSAGAAVQAAELARAGYRTAVRIVEIKEKGGRWWRLYLGSFPSRQAAKAAMPALLARLGEPWAEPARIRESTP